MNGVFRISGVLKLDEGEGRPPPILEIDEDDLAELVEEVLYVLRPDVRREVAHVYPALVVAASVGHRRRRGNN